VKAGIYRLSQSGARGGGAFSSAAAHSASRRAPLGFERSGEWSFASADVSRYGHRPDGAVVARCVAPFEKDAELQTFVHHPLLERHELDMKPAKLLLVLLPLQFAASFVFAILGVGHGIVLQSTSSISHP
jgi:hypothetical protein